MRTIDCETFTEVHAGGTLVVELNKIGHKYQACLTLSPMSPSKEMPTELATSGHPGSRRDARNWYNGAIDVLTVLNSQEGTDEPT